MNVYERMHELGISLPQPVQPVAAFVPFTSTGNLIFVSGHIARISRIVKLLVLVNSDPSFTKQHLVANGVSELFVDLLGDAGKHARSAFGVAQIPFGSCLEVEAVAEIK